jgi:hypothetical protein
MGTEPAASPPIPTSIPIRHGDTGTDLPDHLMTRPVRPVFLSILAAWLALAPIVAVVIPLWLWLGNVDTYTVNGEQATREEFMQHLGQILPGLFALAVLCGFTAWAIFSERPRGRVFAIVTTIVVLAGGPVFNGALRSTAGWIVAIIMAAVVGVPLLWYFYRKRNVVEYYAALEQKDGRDVSAP